MDNACWTLAVDRGRPDEITTSVAKQINREPSQEATCTKVKFGGNMKPYVLGVDSGGTKYLVRAASLDGTILGEFRGDTCSHYNLGEVVAAQRIQKSIQSCLETFGGAPQDCVRIVTGSTGYDSPEDGEILTCIYESLPGFSCPVYCMNDVELAHYSVTGGVGVLALAGTGSIVFGRNRYGEECRVGGWMKSILGDEGSGRYLDARALHHYSRYLDGCRPESALLKQIEATVGSPSRKALMDYSLRMASPPWPSANLGPALDSAAGQGDPYACEILQDAAACILDLVDEAIRLLGMQHDPCLLVGIWGSVILNSDYQRDAFRRMLLEKYPHAELCIPTMDAAQGAIEIALRWNTTGGDCRDVLHGSQRRVV